MIPHNYVWFFSSLVFFICWIGLFWGFPKYRKVMLWSSFFTAFLGLSEPLFVPEYWNPPSLFNLAQKTGFDIESIIFCFAIGGVCPVIYNIITGKQLAPVSKLKKRLPLHRHHYFAFLSPLIAFIVLYPLPWNPIYPVILALLVGAVATVLCRPDLKTKTWVGGLLFFGFYALFFLFIEWLEPGYVDHVWNFQTITGIKTLGIPIEELLFAFSFGLYWSGVYEHLTWREVKGKIDDVNS